MSTVEDVRSVDGQSQIVELLSGVNLSSAPLLPLESGQRIYFSRLDGLILSSQKRAETYVHGGGGVTVGHGGDIYGYTDPIGSTVVTAHEFWLDTGDRELFMQLRGADVPLREGQLVTLVGASRHESGSEAWVALVNHSAKCKFLLPQVDILGEWTRYTSRWAMPSLVLAGISAIVLWIGGLIISALVVSSALSAVYLYIKTRSRSVSNSQHWLAYQTMKKFCNSCMIR